MKFFLRYEWPGNIDELRYNLEPLFIIAAAYERLIDLPGLFFPRRVFAETGVVLEKK
jgi:transcriptional regulator with PAS, ATPase and Fis domain